ncbi:hypothetical protein BWI17_01970 [Betaproteobacteria bacterium GR16-43]|nr:hypothetical protein BWI17_01970 [Betaproteobacteria bacterium GR16-43]
MIQPSNFFLRGPYGTPDWDFATNSPGALPGAYPCGLIESIDGARFGGCVRVGFGWILTAHHVVDIPDMVTRFRATFGYVNNATKGTAYSLSPEDFFCSDDGIQGPNGLGFTRDYAFIRIANPQQDPSTIHMGTARVLPPQKGEELHIPQHRSRRAMQISREHSIEFPDVGRVVSVKDPHLIFHRCSTYEGSSGSPIFDTHWKVLGLHTHGFRPNSKDDIVRELNWGTRIDSIAADAKARGFKFLDEMPLLAPVVP